ncbi:acetate kinase [Dehalobacter sp. DCM]|uniref:acetate/propionate family kinase n=1 Tax=Dehalobacter sp. DCM TaxID=2907827 RepID=UPI003081A12C|nr:acetate kinase [Dehalobacter sp. DCM]
MKILVLNCGSSSLKYQLMDMMSQDALAKGLVERIGLPGAMLTHRPKNGEKEVIVADLPDHTSAIKLVLQAVADPEYGVVESLNEIDAVGHRVLHGGEKVSGSVLVTHEVKQAIEECFELGPLHNPANLAGIIACEQMMPGTPQVAVFDTAFHQTMPPEAYIYGIPYEYYQQYKIRRYGFHGTSHKYVSQRAAVILGKKPDKLKLISCHLGNGSSITAVKYGKSVETSMGFTPLEGLMMGTRSGDIDPTIVSFIMKKDKISGDAVNALLNKKSGVLGLSGVSSDFRDLEKAADEGNYRAQLALDVFVHDVKKYIGAYAAILDGVDGIIFTAGLGENSPMIRSSICNTLSYLGVSIDEEKNEASRGAEVDISKWGARCKVLVIPTNEELMIALDTKEIIEKM